MKLVIRYSTRFSFTNLQTTNYPYVFGGIPKKPENPTMKGFMTQLFDPEVFSGFQIGYNAILSSL